MRPRFALILVLALSSACSRVEAPATESASTPPPAESARPAGGRLFVTNEVSGDISVIDVAAQKVITTIRSGSGPAGFVSAPMARHSVFVP
jgi:YVTN family beta-propeller protein